MKTVTVCSEKEEQKMENIDYPRVRTWGKRNASPISVCFADIRYMGK